MAALIGALILLVSVVAAQDDCSNLIPIFVDFHARAVDGGINEQYGLFTGIGFPASQNLSQWPSLSNNETTVASLDYCTGSPFKDCLNHAHGFYSPDLSQNFSPTSSYQSLDNYGAIPATIDEIALDTFNLFTHYFDPSPPNITRISNFPVTVLSNYSSNSTPWFGPAGLVGLGPDSTLLSHLFDSQLISSRSFGLYMGTAYEQANGAINGSLTLGGYDSGRFDGAVYNYTVGQPSANAGDSPFKVSVQQMTLTDFNGQTTDLLKTSFDADITTSQYHLNLPGNVMQGFADATRATPSTDGLDVFQLPENFNSKLTITLESGLSIEYDATWLKNLSNNSPISTGTIRDGTTNNTANLLGTAFLSNVYFMANYDSTPPTFHLANALPYAPYVMTQTLCPNTVPAAATAHKISSFAASGIAGAIVGGVVGGLGLSFVLFWLFRKCMQKRRWRGQARENMKGKGNDSESTIGGAAGFAAGKGKGSPSTLDSENDRGDDSEMATFAFDFNSQQHQAYVNYLNTASQQPDQQQPRPQQSKSGLSRTYTQFVRQISRENVASSRENLALGAAPHGHTPPPAASQTQIPTQQTYRPPYPAPSPHFQQAHDPVSPLSYTAPSVQYARARPFTSSSDMLETPITPATGVPLLYSSSSGDDSASIRTATIQTLKHGPFHPLTLNHSNISLQDSIGASQSRNDNDNRFYAQRNKSRDGEGNVSGTGAKGLALNVQTEFAPPPRKTTTGKVARKAVAKREGLLKKVFPPS